MDADVSRSTCRGEAVPGTSRKTRRLLAVQHVLDDVRAALTQ
jgi:hypothetical protein